MILMNQMMSLKDSKPLKTWNTKQKLFDVNKVLRSKRHSQDYIKKEHFRLNKQRGILITWYSFFIDDSMLTDLIRVHRRNKMLSKQIVESFKRKDTNRIPFYDMPKEIKVTIDSIVANSDQISDVSKIKFRRDSKTRSSNKRKRNYCHSSLDQYVYM